MQTAPDCSTIPLCSCALRQKERQVAAKSANSLQHLRNTVQLLCNFCATERSLLARADSFFLQRRDSPRAFCCDCALQCLGSDGKKYIACAS